MPDRTIGLRRLSVARTSINCSGDIMPQRGTTEDEVIAAVDTLVTKGRTRVKGHGLSYISANDAPATEMEKSQQKELEQLGDH
jgi:hypothetical protein